MTVITFFINFFIGIAKLIIGLIFSSYWFIITAGYYIVLSVARGHLLRSYANIERNQGALEKRRNQLIIMRRSGYFIIFLGLTYFISCVYMYLVNQKVVYPEYILYGIVAFAFYKIGTAIYDLFAVKKHNNQILLAIKIIKFIDACVSIVATQCALLTMENSASASSSSAILGMAFSGVFMLIGVVMIMKKFKSEIHN